MNYHKMTKVCQWLYYRFFIALLRSSIIAIKQRENFAFESIYTFNIILCRIGRRYPYLTFALALGNGLFRDSFSKKIRISDLERKNPYIDSRYLTLCLNTNFQLVVNEEKNADVLLLFSILRETKIAGLLISYF